MAPIRYTAVASVMLLACTVGGIRPPNTGGPETQCTHKWDDNHLPHAAIQGVYLINTSSFVTDLSVWNRSGNPVRLQPEAPGFPIEVVDRGDAESGWLGLAEIWKRGGHVVRGRVSINMVAMRLSAARYGVSLENMVQHVGWQEVGHIAGLGHQRGVDDSAMEDCVGRANWPRCISRIEATVFNAHDFEQLRGIYAHVTGDKPPACESDANPETPLIVHAFPAEGADDHRGDDHR